MQLCLLSVFKTRARPTILTLYKSLVRSHLEYCCPLWNPTKIGDNQQLESGECSKNVYISHIWSPAHELLGEIKVIKSYVTSKKERKIHDSSNI